MQTERRVAANPQTKPVDLGCESAENWQLSSTSTIAVVIITQPIGRYSFCRPTKGGRLSRPRHCSKGAQPVLKTVYHSSCRDKHNWQRRDSNLGPLTPQSDALTTRLLRPAVAMTGIIDAASRGSICNQLNHHTGKSPSAARVRTRLPHTIGRSVNSWK